ncbi:bcl-2-related ovarian killer protein homolog A-like isoform X4 [Oncorhynchus keta]|uniref:bcl-2-related ovarian killer protein homolog A-like isoform X4 n=1 Tax=Oncorhynchus keta TaxID=8018 RepID=UPI00227AAB9A|nr:bcl-2-related ovarian killer protein homolog A-like isoform X4 [Oncorhynchus keta]
MEVIRRSSVFAVGVMEAFDHSPSDKELVSKSKALCRDYIHSRLNLYGLGSSKTQVDSTLCDVAAVLLCLGITWGKVVSMYAVAGALAVDCVRQNQPATVQTIVDSLGQFVRKNLAPWLKKRGGWVTLEMPVFFQTDIKRCVVKLDAVPQTHWLSPIAQSCKHFLSTLYIYIMKEP